MSGITERAVAVVRARRVVRDLGHTMTGTCISCLHHRVDTDRAKVQCVEFNCDLDDDSLARGPQECPSFEDDIPF